MKTSVFCAASMDGYIATSDDGLDWLNPFEGDDHGYNEFISTIDAIVIGRRTFDVVLGFGGWHFAMPVFVLSSTLKQLPKLPKRAVCELMGGEPKQIVATLEHRGFKHLYIDGGITIQRFLRDGLIDRMVITRIPVLLGGGIPLFASLPHNIRLKHVNTRSYKSGMVQSEYEVLK